MHRWATPPLALLLRRRLTMNFPGVMTRGALGGVVLAVALGATAPADPSSPRLRDGRLPARMPPALGGGEVLLELTITPEGTVQRLDRLRTTPPYTDLLAEAVVGWRFEPATTIVEGKKKAATGHVLVVALFRPPTLYAGTSAGGRPESVGIPSPYLPSAAALGLPAYPPMALGDGLVLIEMEMAPNGELRGTKVVGASSGFDEAALDAVKRWRFTPARAPGVPGTVFVYAVLGFRAPLGPASAPPR